MKGAPAGAERPLVVDLDGTLLESDMLAEAFLALLAARPLAALSGLAAVRHGRAALKAKMAAAASPDLALLPWNGSFIEWLRGEKARGRRLYLASASDRAQVDAVARRFGLFDGIFASDGRVNLKSRAKAAALVAAFGEGGFDYAGNEAADLAVWRHAGGVVGVGLESGLRRRVLRQWPDATILPTRRASLSDWLHVSGAAWWWTALLVVLPATATGRFDGAVWLRCVAAGTAILASTASGFTLGGLLDLGRDRTDPERRSLPFASGRIPPPRGIKAAIVGTAVAVVAALPVAAILPVLILQAALAILGQRPRSGVGWLVRFGLVLPPLAAGWIVRG